MEASYSELSQEASKETDTGIIAYINIEKLVTKTQRNQIKGFLLFCPKRPVWKIRLQSDFYQSPKHSQKQWINIPKGSFYSQMDGPPE